MLSEVLHSTADTGNELLLFLGLRSARRPPDREHPFGHSQDVYFWSLIVAIMLFSTGAGSAIYEGVSRLGRRETGIQNAYWGYLVLGVSLVIEGFSWFVAYRQLRKSERPNETFWHNLTTTKDPSLLVVFGENTADIAGLLTALAGQVLSQVLRSQLPDLIAAIVIGVILAVVAAWLAFQSRSLLIGETADLQLVEDVQKLTSAHPGVAWAGRPLTMQLGPRDVLLCLDVEFKQGLPAEQLVRGVDEIERKIRDEHPSVRQVFIDIERLGEPHKQKSS